MSDLPPDAAPIRYRIAAVVPCPDSARTRTKARKPWCLAFPNDGGYCDGCLGDGTRTVVTYVKVECGEVFCNDDMEFVTDRAVTLPNGAEVWREVPRD